MTLTISPSCDIKRLTLITALAYLFLPAKSYAVTLQTQVQTVIFNPTVYVDYNYGGFLKFNTKLGTLRAVTLKLNSVSLGGSFVYTQGSSGTSTITAINLDVLFYAASSLNNTAHDGLITDYDVGYLPRTGSVSILNQVLPKTIARKGSATFNFDPTRNLLTEPVVILNLSTSTDLAFYKGTGISFAPAFTSVTQFLVAGTYAGNPVRDYSKLSSTVSMSLYYDYIPATIPEPSYFGLGLGLATLGLCVRRRISINRHHATRHENV